MTRALWFLGMVVTAAAITPCARANQFERRHYYSIGTQQKGVFIIATQLTNSGNFDLVVSDFTNNVSVLLGDGDGTFQKPIIFPVPDAWGLAAGDFNEDGNQDLAVVEYGSGRGAVAIFLGDGTGHFKAAGTYAMGAGTLMVAVADFNQDGHLDLAVTNAGVYQGSGESVMTLFGDGRGGFSNLKTYPVKAGAYPYGVAAGDVNGDGYPDLAVATGFGDSVAVFLNDGTGGFSVPTYYGVQGHPTDVKMADLRNGGLLDLVAADPGAGMDVWLNNGDGTFGSVATYTPKFLDWEPPDGCTVADFNLDGKPDVACAGPHSYAYWFRGNGDGTFKAGVELREGNPNTGGSYITSGDFNNDGVPDLAIQLNLEDAVSVMLNAK